MADPLTTTLVLMYFITPPAKTPPGESKEIRESKAVWTLQSTDHIETEDSNSLRLVRPEASSGCSASEHANAQGVLPLP